MNADQRRARFVLRRISDEGLRRIVTEPLCLAGIDAADREALAVQVLRDVGERLGDLALVQMALTETWQARDCRVLSWSEDGTARLWDISELPEGQLIGMACRSLRGDHDTSGLKDRYGIAITTPICTSGAPAAVDEELQE